APRTRGRVAARVLAKVRAASRAGRAAGRAEPPRFDTLIVIARMPGRWRSAHISPIRAGVGRDGL
ncbi:hypothetical protein, partial [uncultured Sphingomonas sp.]|uniref:hypothetical protein n=1 Tax=uncultured Sphingomonas sp. TaxID=158754 RepID=UPI00262525D4